MRLFFCFAATLIACFPANQNAAAPQINFEPTEDFLLAACANGASSIVDMFLGPYPVVSVKFQPMTRLKTKCFLLAAENGHLSILKDFVSGRSLTDLSHAIEKALENKHHSVVLYLLSLISPENQLEMQLYCLGLAACAGDNALLKTLLSRDSSVILSHYDSFNMLHDSENDPLICAIENGHLDTVKYLAGSFPGSLGNRQLLTAAIRSGNLEILDYFVSIQGFGNCNQEFLAAAVYSGNPKMVQLALSECSRQQLTISQEQGKILIDMAPNLDVLDLLIRHYGNDLTFSGLYNAVAYERYELVLFYLDHLEMNSPSLIPLLFEEACLNGHPDILKALITAYGPVLDQVHLDRCLEIVAEEGNAEAIDVLLHGAYKANPAANQNTPIINAAASGNINAMNRILGSGNPHVDPSARGNKAFMDAVAQENVKVLQFLLSIKNQFPGINPADRDNFAIKYARKYGLCHIVDFLLSLPPEMGIDHGIALMDPSDINL